MCIRVILALFGVAAALLFAYWGMWFNANAEPDTLDLRAMLFWLGFGSVVGAPFFAIALPRRPASVFGRMSRVFGGLALLLPGWLFGGIALEHFRRFLSGGGYLLGSFAIGFGGLLAVLFAVVYVFIVEAKE